MDVTVRWHGRGAPHEFEFEGATAEGLTAAIGARSREGGPKVAPTPKELVAMAMAACSGIDLVSILASMRQPLGALRIQCSLVARKEPPTVFESCVLTYVVEGADLLESRVVRALALSLGKHCGVSIMVARSGCAITPKLRLNGCEIALPSMEEMGRQVAAGAQEGTDGQGDAP